MRKLIIFILICAAGLVALDIWHPILRNNGITLPKSVAWKTSCREASGPSRYVVTIVHGDRWRMEARSSKRKIFVAVFDGSEFASTNPKATAVELDPRVAMSKMLAPLNRRGALAIEQRDGHSCWRFWGFSGWKSANIWVDTTTRFPVFMEGTDPNGVYFEAGYRLLPIDPASYGDELFSTQSVEPMFSEFLGP
jgi:hypothetical protein